MSAERCSNKSELASSTHTHADLDEDKMATVPVMSLQTAQPREHSFTDVAAEWFLSRVDHLVLLQICRQFKCSSALNDNKIRHWTNQHGHKIGCKMIDDHTSLQTCGFSILLELLFDRRRLGFVSVAFSQVCAG